MKNYSKVVPRDFFNEAKLLKCLGFLSLYILDNNFGLGRLLEDYYDNEPFRIYNTIDGDIYVENYIVKIKKIDEPLILLTHLNSKENFPLYLITDEYEHIKVFNEKGEPTKEFLKRIKNG